MAMNGTYGQMRGQRNAGCKGGKSGVVAQVQSWYGAVRVVLNDEGDFHVYTCRPDGADATCIADGTIPFGKDPEKFGVGCEDGKFEVTYVDAGMMATLAPIPMAGTAAARRSAVVAASGGMVIPSGMASGAETSKAPATGKITGTFEVHDQVREVGGKTVGTVSEVAVTAGIACITVEYPDGPTDYYPDETGTLIEKVSE